MKSGVGARTCLRQKAGNDFDGDRPMFQIDFLYNIVNGRNEHLAGGAGDNVDVVLRRGQDIRDATQLSPVEATDGEADKLKSVVLAFGKLLQITLAHLDVGAPQCPRFLPTIDAGELQTVRAPAACELLDAMDVSLYEDGPARGEDFVWGQKLYLKVAAKPPGADHATGGHVAGGDIAGFRR